MALLIFLLIVFEFIIAILYTQVDGQESNSVKLDTNFTSIHIGKNPNGIAVDPTNHMVYVTRNDTNKISVIDENTNKVIENNISSVGSGFYGIAINPNNHKIYVTNFNNNSIWIGNASGPFTEMHLERTITKPNGIAVDPNSSKIYVTSNDSNVISVIDEKTNKVIENISTIDIPTAIAVDSNNSTV